ncbi:MAG: ATP-binding protein [Planctomycetaceae bacterium]
MGWRGIEGHDAVLRAFATAAARGRVSGSYLLVGPPGVGKTTVALELAKALVCPRAQGGIEACGACASCVQAAAGSHPDIDVVAKPEDRATIPLEALIGDKDHRMREGLCWRILLAPALGARKVAIIRDADHLSVEAANCLLKTLEEPPGDAVIMLVGTALERQLPTIRSRCQIVRFRPLPEEVVRRVLESEAAGGGDPAAIRAAAAAAGGSLSRARLLLDPDVAAFRARLVELLAQRPLRGVELARDTIALVEAAGKEAPPRRGRLRVVLEAAIDFYRAALRHAAAGEPPPDEASARALAARPLDADEAVTSLRLTLDALARIDRNANLTVLVDAWTALLEEPRLEAASRG